MLGMLAISICMVGEAALHLRGESSGRLRACRRVNVTRPRRRARYTFERRPRVVAVL